MQTLKSKIVPTAEGERLQIVVVIRWDLPMTHSKLTQQCCKALLAVHRNASRSAADTVKAWESEGEKLVLLQGPGGLEQLQAIEAMATACDLPTVLVTDDVEELRGSPSVRRSCLSYCYEVVQG
eukprot:scaffold1541_cov256-Pinguiococcus_pyrenoidosus.AAC.25